MKYWVSMVLLLSLVNTGSAQQEVIDTHGTHTVVSGDTLSGITQHYLGDSAFWRENWKLNPQVENPNRLRLGQVLNVIIERQVIAQSARVNFIANEVDKNLQRSQWQPAAAGDELIERDGIRTLRASSAELQFNNNSILRLSEYSQIFLETKKTSLRGIDQGRIEVREGSAELVFEPITPRRTEIELVAGNSVATAGTDASGRGQLRTAASDDGSAQVMVYEGRSEVVAAGAQVEVGRGFGTAVPESGPPAPPERLLRAPPEVAAGPGEQWRVGNEVVAWQPVGGAEAYIVEVCRDRACGALVARQQSTDAQWQPELEPGEYFIRVAAVAPSKLQGYPSEPIRIVIERALIDEQPPELVVVPIGFRQWQVDDWIVGPDSKIRLVANDLGVGVKRVEYRWGAGSWQLWTGDDISIPLGVVELEARASDHFDQVRSLRVAIN